MDSQQESKHSEYQLLVKQALALLGEERDLIANSANLSALLFNNLERLNWVGLYFKRGDELVLGPFQGQVACVRIPMGRGVCGTAASSAEVQRIHDVHQFEGHIACDTASNSEIVIPLFYRDEVVAVLDIDSPIVGRFDEIDQAYLTQIAEILTHNSDWV